MKAGWQAGGLERRRHPRAVLDWPVMITLSDGTFQARLRDISRSGICFYLDRRIPEMTVLGMELELPPPGDEGGGEERGARVSATGVVVRCQALSKHVDHYEIALFLNELREEAREVIDAYVDWARD